jgi:microsomal prostaglandin-E synthase 2
VVISILKTFLFDRSHSLDQIEQCYPSLETKNERGKKVLEFPNKYFVMFFDAQSDKTPDALK